MADRVDDVIDLSDSFNLADHRAVTNDVIELDTDESGLFDDLEPISVVVDPDVSFDELLHAFSTTNSTLDLAVQSVPSKKTRKNKKLNTNVYCKFMADMANIGLANKVKKRSKFGECPVCFDPLGRNPLASTICGHVYCMKCIKQYLKVDKRCPTCRQNLNKKSSYHPLYLNIV